MTTISNRWPHVGHCRLFEVTPPGGFLFFQYNRAQLSTKYLEESCRILCSFRKVLIGNTIVTYLESSCRANKIHIANWRLFIFSFYSEFIAMLFQIRKIFVLVTDRIDSRTLCLKSYRNQFDEIVHIITLYGNSGFFQY